MPQKYTAFKPALRFPNQAIAYIYSNIDRHKQLLQPICKNLPAELATHVLHCLIKQRKLIIYTDSATWASQLRFYKGATLIAASTFIKEPVTELQVKILTPQVRLESTLALKPLIPSADQIKLIRSAGLASSDEQLKLALLKLSATLQSLSNKD
ncbi:MAG: DciA family protein [Methylococcales bacterium]|nr:DUF721 domain-containing protein [Methylococcaceae bacterium]